MKSWGGFMTCLRGNFRAYGRLCSCNEINSGCGFVVLHWHLLQFALIMASGSSTQRTVKNLPGLLLLSQRDDSGFFSSLLLVPFIYTVAEWASTQGLQGPRFHCRSHQKGSLEGALLECPYPSRPQIWKKCIRVASGKTSGTKTCAKCCDF